MIKKIRPIIENLRIQDKLDELAKYYEELGEDLPSEDEFIEDRLIRRSIEKTVELIADTIIDIAFVLISSLKLDKPQDSRAALQTLEGHKIISKHISAKIKDLVSFRNLLVHRYGKVDSSLEYNCIKENESDIGLFIEEIDTYLKKRPIK
ncbi:DUF86 domain-containing protein [Candidatus Woesearchaeota archaeon]|nr:DUF86 domain-containing protein [Candidatus Woesearchaeota archaeon]